MRYRFKTELPFHPSETPMRPLAPGINNVPWCGIGGALNPISEAPMVRHQGRPWSGVRGALVRCQGVSGSCLVSSVSVSALYEDVSFCRTRLPRDSLNGSQRGVTPPSLPERFVTAAAAPSPPPPLRGGGRGRCLLVSEGRKHREMSSVGRRLGKN